jgi:hypothetical protein
MKPSQLATTLRRIASNIERSRNPDRTLVAKDLKRVIVALAAIPSLVGIQLETNQFNDAGVAWYASFNGPLDVGLASDPQFQSAIKQAVLSSGEELTDIFDIQIVPSPNSVSEFRYFVGMAA